MASDDAYLLTVNAGSSSIKLAVFALDEAPKKVCEAVVEGIGQPASRLVTRPAGEANGDSSLVNAADHLAAARILADWLERQMPEASIAAVGHRIVHGGPQYHRSQVIDERMIADLRQLAPFDPEHLPVEIELVEIFQRLLPNTTQVACFDTAFHHDLPTVARMLPIPRQLEAKGIRRYGFHGLSYAYILEELHRVEGEVAANGKVIVAHLGSGASLAALQEGKPIDTTMSMTPASGIPMSTRSGDLDPGLALYLARTEGYDAERFNRMVNSESGLLGISETTADMKRLLAIEADDERAKDAVDIFCYQVKKSIGALTAALGGLNTLVFTGGMGENAPKIRARICDGLEFLGVNLDTDRNEAGVRLISADGGLVGVHIIRTDEAVTMARQTAELIRQS